MPRIPLTTDFSLSTFEPVTLPELSGSQIQSHKHLAYQQLLCYMRLLFQPTSTEYRKEEARAIYLLGLEER